MKRLWSGYSTMYFYISNYSFIFQLIQMILDKINLHKWYLSFVRQICKIICIIVIMANCNLMEKYHWCVTTKNGDIIDVLSSPIQRIILKLLFANRYLYLKALRFMKQLIKCVEYKKSFWLEQPKYHTNI